MSSVINRPASPEAGKEPNPGIVQHYKERLQALGIFTGRDEPVHPNGPAPHHLVVSERERDRDA